jgi:spermidine/putrescine transport system ATP-binding protein
MSDHVAVMREGVIEQIGDGRAIYDDPATAFVASFVGENNALPGRVAELRNGVALIETAVGRMAARVATAARDKLRPGAEAILFIRPEALDIDAAGAPPEATIETRVTGEEFEGPNLHLQLTHAGGTELRASLVNKGTARAVQHGGPLKVAFDPMKAVALPAGALSEEE